MNRRNLAILLGLLLLSILLSEGIALLLPPLHHLFYFLLAGTIFLLLFLLFDNVLWRFLPLSGMPNIHGDWIGRLSSSYQENSEVEPAQIRIVQRWLSIRIDFVGKYSTSSSYTSLFFRDKEGQYYLTYIYRAEPYADATAIMNAHIGLTVMRLLEKDRFSGQYHHLEATDEGLQLIHGQLVWTRNKTT